MELPLTLLPVPYKKKRGAPAMMKWWLTQIGGEVRRIRLSYNKEKQEAFAGRVGISRSTLTAIENGRYGYGIDALLKALAAGKTDPAATILGQALPASNQRHVELHTRLQELLDADGEWPMAAEVNVDAVWSLYRERKKRKAS